MRAATITCPACHSDDVRSVPMVHEEGTFEAYSEGTIRPNTVALLSGADYWEEQRSVSTAGRHQSALAGRLSPPKKPSPWSIPVGFFLIYFIGFFAILWILSLWSPGEANATDALEIALGFAVVVPIWRYLHHLGRWQAQRQIWERSWVCTRCGQVFVAQAPPADESVPWRTG